MRQTLKDFGTAATYVAVIVGIVAIIIGLVHIANEEFVTLGDIIAVVGGILVLLFGVWRVIVFALDHSRSLN